jgi:AraC-like DNA-binding protein
MYNKNNFSLKVLKAFDKSLEYINQHPMEWKSPDDLATYAGINKVTLQSVFKYKTGKSISEYWEIMRIEAACVMLADGEFIIKEIATQCGYNRQSNFCNAFKKVKKVSPSEWQRMNVTVSLSSEPAT